MKSNEAKDVKHLAVPGCAEALTAVSSPLSLLSSAPPGLLPFGPGSESSPLGPLCLFSFPSEFQILPSPNLVPCNSVSLKFEGVPLLEISWMFVVFSCP